MNRICTTSIAAKNMVVFVITSVKLEVYDLRYFPHSCCFLRAGASTAADSVVSHITCSLSQYHLTRGRLYIIIDAIIQTSMRDCTVR